MVITNGYCTDDQFKSLMGFTGAAHDDDIDRAVETASRAIDRFCGRRFWVDSTVATRYYTPIDGRYLEVDDISATTGLLVTTDSQLDNTFEQSWTQDDFSGSYGFQLSPVNEGAPWSTLEALAGSWPLLRRSVKVIAKFGFASVPIEIESACMLFASRFYKRKDSPFGTIESPGGPVARVPAVDPDIANTIGQYRRYARVNAA